MKYLTINYNHDYQDVSNKTFQDILQISKASAGYVILIAQLTDAFFNLVMGAECDKINILKGKLCIERILFLLQKIFNSYAFGMAPRRHLIFKRIPGNF